MLAAGQAGIQCCRRRAARPRVRLKVAADVNAVPPPGIEGVGVQDDGKPIAGTARRRHRRARHRQHQVSCPARPAAAHDRGREGRSLRLPRRLSRWRASSSAEVAAGPDRRAVRPRARRGGRARAASASSSLDLFGDVDTRAAWPSDARRARASSRGFERAAAAATRWPAGAGERASAWSMARGFEHDAGAARRDERAGAAARQLAGDGRGVKDPLRLRRSAGASRPAASGDRARAAATARLAAQADRRRRRQPYPRRRRPACGRCRRVTSSARVAGRAGLGALLSPTGARRACSASASNGRAGDAAAPFRYGGVRRAAVSAAGARRGDRGGLRCAGRRASVSSGSTASTCWSTASASTSSRSIRGPAPRSTSSTGSAASPVAAASRRRAPGACRRRRPPQRPRRAPPRSSMPTGRSPCRPAMRVAGLDRRPRRRRHGHRPRRRRSARCCARAATIVAARAAAEAPPGAAAAQLAGIGILTPERLRHLGQGQSDHATPQPRLSINRLRRRSSTRCSRDAAALRLGVTRDAVGRAADRCRHRRLPAASRPGAASPRSASAASARSRSAPPPADSAGPGASPCTRRIRCSPASAANMPAGASSERGRNSSRSARARHARWPRKEELFDELGYRDRPTTRCSSLEVDKPPPPALLVEQVAADCGVAPDRLTLHPDADPQASPARVQIAARSLEVALHKAHELHFPLDRIVDGIGTAPLPPPAPDFVARHGPHQRRDHLWRPRAALRAGPDAEARGARRRLCRAATVARLRHAPSPRSSRP